jgi:hypothetical protein
MQMLSYSQEELSAPIATALPPTNLIPRRQPTTYQLLDESADAGLYTECLRTARREVGGKRLVSRMIYIRDPCSCVDLTISGL